MMLVWNNLADPHLSAFSDFARFSQTSTLKITNHKQVQYSEQVAVLIKTRV